MLKHATYYIEQVRLQQQKWEMWHKQQQEKIEEVDEESLKLLSELERLVAAAEEASQNTRAVAGPIAGPHALTDEEIVEVTKSIEEAGRSAVQACSACADFIMARRPAMEASEKHSAQAQQKISEAQPRIQQATESAAHALHLAKAHKEQAVKKMAATKHNESQVALFQKYNASGSGALSVSEIIAYAQGEYQFELGRDKAEHIARQTAGPEGVLPGQLQRLRTLVGIALEEARAQKRRLEKQGGGGGGGGAGKEPGSGGGGLEARGSTPDGLLPQQ